MPYQSAQMAAILIRAFRSGKVVESLYLRLALVVVRLILKIIAPGSEWIGGANSSASSGYFAHKSLFGKSERSVHLIDLGLIGLHLINLHLIGLHFIGRHLIGRHLKAWISWACIS